MVQDFQVSNRRRRTRRSPYTYATPPLSLRRHVPPPRPSGAPNRRGTPAPLPLHALLLPRLPHQARPPFGLPPQVLHLLEKARMRHRLLRRLLRLPPRFPEGPPAACSEEAAPPQGAAVGARRQDMSRGGAAR